MTMHVNVAGTWRQVQATGLYVNVAGTWRQVQQGWVNVGGTWRQFHQAAVYSVWAGNTVSHSFLGGASVAIGYESDGDIVATITTGSSDVSDWVAPKSLAPGAYTIRASLASGTAPNSGDALDTDLALTSSRSWGQNQSGVGTRSCVLTITLKDGGGNTLASGNVTLTAQGV